MMKIVIGVDGSPGSQHATRWVAEHGPDLDARVTAVLVVPRVEIWELASVQIDSGPDLAKRRAYLDGAWTDPLRAAGLQVITRMLRGDPGAQLCKLAESRAADLLVIGAKSRSTLPHLLGGTAHKVANHSPCPVLLVTAPGKKQKR